MTHQGFVANKMLLFGSPANLALALWIWGEEEKVCISCTNSTWFVEKLLEVADRVFCSTAVNIQGLGKELGIKTTMFLELHSKLGLVAGPCA